MIRTFIAISILLISFTSHATVISYNGYERDSATNIIKGQGLDWLKWDLTNGMSVHSALETYKSEGWSLANRVQMVNLFNAFNFGLNDWSDALGSYEGNTVAWSTSEETSHSKFIQLFGSTKK